DYSLPQNLCGIAPNACIRVELWRQCASDLVEIEQSFAKHGELRWHTNLAVGRAFCDFENEAAHLHLLDRGAFLLPHDFGNAANKVRWIKFAPRLSDLVRDLGNVFATPFGNGDQQLQQLPL